MGELDERNGAPLYSTQSPSINGTLLFLAHHCGHGDIEGWQW